MSKYIADNLSLEDTDELLKWLNQNPANETLLKELQEVWDKTRDYPESLTLDSQNAWLKVKRSVQSSEYEKRRKKPGIFISIRQLWHYYLNSIYRRFL